MSTYNVNRAGGIPIDGRAGVPEEWEVRADCMDSDSTQSSPITNKGSSYRLPNFNVYKTEVYGVIEKFPLYINTTTPEGYEQQKSYLNSEFPHIKWEFLPFSICSSSALRLHLDNYDLSRVRGRWQPAETAKLPDNRRMFFTLLKICALQLLIFKLMTWINTFLE